MLRYLGVIALILVLIQSVFSQEVSGIHSVQLGVEPNEYTIKTTIKGLEGVDIARIKYVIDNNHTYKASPNNALFSDRNESYIKFYIMAVPASGELNIELGVVLSDGAEYAFPVEFQFSKNEEKQTINLPQIYFSGDGAIALVETPEPTVPAVEETSEVEEKAEIVEPSEPVVPEVEEEPVVETPEPTVPTVEETPEVEEEPETVEIPAPVVPEVEEEPAVETPEPVDLPIVEETPEVEEEPETVEVSAPVVPEVEEEPVVVKPPEPVTPEVEEELVVETPEPTVPAVEETPEVEEEPEAVEIPALVVPEVEEEPVPDKESRTTIKYTVQLLSLAEFSQSRLNFYCKQHNLSVNDVKKRKVGNWMKITYGEANSIQEANQIKEKLMRNNNITEAFVTTIK